MFIIFNLLKFTDASCCLISKSAIPRLIGALIVSNDVHLDIIALCEKSQRAQITIPECHVTHVMSHHILEIIESSLPSLIQSQALWQKPASPSSALLFMVSHSESLT